MYMRDTLENEAFKTHLDELRIDYTVILFQMACAVLNVDIISVDMTEKVPYFFKKPSINMVCLHKKMHRNTYS